MLNPASIYVFEKSSLDKKITKFSSDYSQTTFWIYLLIHF